MNINGLDDILPQLVDWRRDFHAHPEIAYREYRTAGIVAEALSSFGCAVTTGLAGTGVVGVLDFGPGPSIGLRADMDALPIEEETGAAYASRNRGLMHACGHDGHTAMLLGAAALLSRRRNLKGKVVFVFQPAEENEGGARAMIEDGLFERFAIDAMFGLHNMPGVPVGEVRARAGPVSSAFDTFDIVVKGRGGHGAMPELAADPIVAAAALVQGLNTIVSRNLAPFDNAVISVCAVNAGETYNVIPDAAYLKGSCRTFESGVQEKIRRRIAALVDGVAAAHGVDIDLDYRMRYPAVVNSERETALLRQVVSARSGEWIFNDDFRPLMGSEDFSFYLREKPGCFFIIGNGADYGPLHSPTYDFNDEALPVGAALWSRLAETYLAGAPGARR